MANVRQVILKLVGDPDDAERALAKVTEDLRHFDRFNAEATADIKTEAAKAKLDQLEARLVRLGNQEATPRVKIAMGRTIEQIDRLKLKLDELDHKRVEPKVTVDRNLFSRILGGGGQAAETGIQGVSAGLAGLLGNLPVIGGLFQGLSGSLGTTALGAGAATVAILALVAVLAALAASLGAAIAGLGALTVALAGALGPAVLVLVGAFTRFAAIIKAVKDHTSNAGKEARGLAGAHDQLTAATDSVTQANANLQEQTTAAYRAWADAIETVKDDLLDVQHAELGIAQSHLTLRQAVKTLKDFRAETGTAGKAFDQLFRRFTNVDFKGDPSKLVAAIGKGGTSLSGDDSLRLQQLVLNVRDAKLGEKDATDRLHDSNVKLKRDRQTEADFTKRQIDAYGPYAAAVRQVATANRQLAAAQRAGASASERQSSAWDKLSPAERQFAKLILSLGDTLSKVFNPVMTALLGGVTKGLQDFGAAASDPKIKSALVDTGRALGDSFAQIIKALSGPGARQGFARFAAAGVQILPKLAHAFANLLVVLGRIGLAATGKNGLGGLIDGFARWTGHLEHSTRNSKDLKEKIDGLVDTFKTWGTFLLAVSGLLFKIGTALAPIGTAIVEFLTHPLQALKDLATQAGFTKTDLKDIGKVLGGVGRAIGQLAKSAETTMGGLLTVIKGVIKIIVGLLTLDFPEAFSGVKDTVHGVLEQIKGILSGALAPFYAIGHKLGHAIGHGITKAFHSVIKFVENRISDLIDAYNSIPLAPNIHNPFHDDVGRVGPGNTNPLNPGGGLGRLPSHHKVHHAVRSAIDHAVRGAIPRPAFPFGGLPAGATTGGGGGLAFHEVTVPITVAGGGPPDPKLLGESLIRELQRLGRG